MTGIVRCKSGNYTYLYESESYLDENGKRRYKRKCIGRIDPITGKRVYYAEYLKRVMGTDKQPKDIEEGAYSTEEAFKLASYSRRYGVPYFLTNISNSLGILDILQTTFPELWNSLISLVFYMLASSDPLMHAKFWQKKNEEIIVEELTTENINKILKSISANQRLEFYGKWAAERLEEELTAFDISPISSYSELIDNESLEYSQDGERLPLINMLMFVGEKSRLPIFQTLYNGSLKDVGNLKSIFDNFSGLNLTNISVVLDKGLTSNNTDNKSAKDDTSNIDDMLDDEGKINFLTSIHLTTKFANDIVDVMKNVIDAPENAIVVEGETILGRTVNQIKWSDNHNINVHAFYNENLWKFERDIFYNHVLRLKEGVISGQYNADNDENVEKYLIVKKSAEHENGVKVSISEDAIDDELITTGWMVAIGNHLKSSKEVLELYREKDVIQKLFNRVKGVINSKRLRLASGDIEENKLLIGFIATILISHIHKVMTDKGLYNKYSLFEVFKILEHIGGIYSKGKRMRYKLTDSQKEIFAAFDCPLPKEIYPQKGIFLKGRHPKKA